MKNLLNIFLREKRKKFYSTTKCVSYAGAIKQYFPYKIVDIPGFIIEEKKYNKKLRSAKKIFSYGTRINRKCGVKKSEKAEEKRIKISRIFFATPFPDIN